MNYIKIIKQQDGSYNVAKRMGNTLNIFVAYFFIDDVGCGDGAEKKRKWLFDHE